MNFRIPAAAAALAVMAVMNVSSPASAQTNLAWCATDRDGAMNCLYETLSQCEATVRGEGGECVPNPRK